jgi:cell division initiation protein
MPLTPVEIRHLELQRAWLRGYRKGTVERLLNEVADSFEEVWRERADLADRLDELETEIAKHRELEALLRSTLVSAERAAHDMKEQARRESDLIVQEAHAEARRVVREISAEKERLEADVRKIRALLRTALETLGDGAQAQESKPEGEPREEAELRPEPEASVKQALDAGIRRVAG